jgi:ABC-type spermidine/putrescine transport system permease subunit I
VKPTSNIAVLCQPLPVTARSVAKAFIPWTLIWQVLIPVKARGCLSSSFCVLLSCVGRYLCDGLISRPEEFY